MPKELTLNQNVEVLVVKIGEKEYKVPLARFLPYKEAKKLLAIKNGNESEMLEAFVGMFSKYIPSDVLEELSLADLTALAKAWTAQNGDGEALGES